MGKYRNLIFYTLTILLFSALIYFVVGQGHGLEVLNPTKNPVKVISTWDQFLDTYRHNFTHPLAMLLLQIITIIIGFYYLKSWYLVAQHFQVV